MGFVHFQRCRYAVCVACMFFIFVLSVCAGSVSCGRFSGDAYGTGKVCMNMKATDFRYLASRLSSDDARPDLDTAHYCLRLETGGGDVVYGGKYASRPSEFELSAGDYVASVCSSDRSMPEFACPVISDRQAFRLDPGEELSLSFMCRQSNAGLRLKVDEDFMHRYPYGYFEFRTGNVSVKYPYSEKRFLYFDEGDVSLFFVESYGNDVELFSRNVDEGEMISLVISDEPRSGNGIRISVDTSRFWHAEDIYPGDIASKAEALSVMEARDAADGSGYVWVCGYIAGGDLTSSRVKTDPPFSSATNIALADSPHETDRDRMISVELPSGEVRDAVNLVSSPDNLGRKVYLFGVMDPSYYGLPGLKKVKAFSWM